MRPKYWLIDWKGVLNKLLTGIGLCDIVNFMHLFFLFIGQDPMIWKYKLPVHNGQHSYSSPYLAVI